MKNTLRKGSAAFQVNIGASKGVATVSITPIQIQSLGAKQGTATEVEGGRQLHHQLYRRADGVIRCRFGWVVATREDVEALVAQEALPIAAQNLVGELDCERSNFPNLWPKYREAAAARIQALEATTPSVVVIWR